ncbi:carbohydrate ABC transporter permease [bacterium C-53]|nr:carbohydrate ABC transporter permease [Lachnospiraceae bacterium]NBI04240.1 carbohydrate ABC transporter permease [Lachnospiraceae bacterium]RKJ08554.1 carbohydrate ABC transporter permease [bacterium C-53]
MKINVTKVFLHILLAAFAIVQVYPLIFLLFFSLKDNNEIYSGNVMGVPHKLHWENYHNALFNANVGHYLVNSIFVTAVVIVVSGILACMVSYAIARMRVRGNNIVKTFFSIGLMIPLHAVLLPVFIMLRNLKMLDTYQAIIVPYIAFALPMAIFFMIGFFQTLPLELEESAFLDGCGIFRTFFTIILPLVKPALATISIFTFLSTWNEMMFAITFINSEKYRTLTVGIMQMVGQYTTDWGSMGAGLVVATLPTVIIYLLFSNQVQSGMVAGAVKG